MSVCRVIPRPAPAATVSIVGAALLTLTLAACGATTTTGSAASSSTTTAGTTSATVRVASTSLGAVVVDTAGRTLYMFSKDTRDSGRSNCAGPCATAWPAYTTTATPTAAGVSGTLGTLTTATGSKQVTLGGWPLYYFDKDTSPGDVHGQDVGKVWFVLDANGTPIRAAATSAAPAPASTTPSAAPTSSDDSVTGY